MEDRDVLNKYLNKYIGISMLDDMTINGTLIGYDDDYLEIKLPDFESEEFETDVLLIPTHKVDEINCYRKDKIDKDRERFKNWLKECKECRDDSEESDDRIEIG